MPVGPIKTIPIFKERVWGGRRLASVSGKHLPEARIGESWEVTVRGEDTNRVASGPDAGVRLDRLFSEDPKRWLGVALSRSPFPLLVKLLDAREQLSVQVHPSDGNAASLPGPDRGKWETWVILAAEPSSMLYRGFRPGVHRREFAEALEAGQPQRCLDEFSVTPGDVIDLPPGTPHAIGPGIVLAEVQQNSDWTFRLHDWGRVGLDGRPRQLHVERALAALDFEATAPRKVAPAEMAHENARRERLVENPFYGIERWQVGPGRTTWSESSGTFEIVLVLSGKGKLWVADGGLPLKTGDTVFLPADHSTPELEAIENLTVLRVYPSIPEFTR